MNFKKYKLGEILNVTRGASLSGEFYTTEGEYIRLTCGNAYSGAYPFTFR